MPADPRPSGRPAGRPSGGTARPAAADDCYVEVLRVPMRWWAVATMFWASLLLAFLVAVPMWVALLVVGTLSALNVAVFASYGGATVSVQEGTFRAGRAAIPVRLLRDPEPLGAEAARRAAGVDADARAYLLLRPYVAGALRVRVADPADPTPYWLVSTRHPGVLAEALAAARAQAGG